MTNGLIQSCQENAGRFCDAPDGRRRTQKHLRPKKYLWDGSYTVEAAFIVPMILGIFYAFLFQLFYIRDQAVMNGMAEDIFIQEYTGTEKASGDERRAQVQACLWLAQLRVLRQESLALQKRLNMEAEAVWDIPVMQRFLGKRFQSRITKSLPALRPEQAVRYRERDKSDKNEEVLRK